MNPSQQALDLFLAEHERDKADQQRLGQRFINRYMGLEDTPLQQFNLWNLNHQRAQGYILEWLNNNHYYSTLPLPYHWAV
jgi:hypothetical protein